MLDWLVKRLTPEKRRTPRWAELAAVVQTYWERLFDPEFNRLYSLSSIYTADTDGQRKIVADLGGYFETNQAVDSLPLYVAMRKYELAAKDTDLAIRMAIQRMGLEGSTGQSLPSLYLADRAGSGKVGELKVRLLDGGVWQMEIVGVDHEASPALYLIDTNGSERVARIEAEIIGRDDAGNDQWAATLTESGGAAERGYWFKDSDGSRKSVLIQAYAFDNGDGSYSWQLVTGESRYINLASVQWLPLWALESDGPYGTKFYHKATGIPEGAYLTSRGMLMVDLASIGQEAIQKINDMVRELLPLHIVYDGLTFDGTDFSQSFYLLSEDNQVILAEDDTPVIT